MDDKVDSGTITPLEDSYLQGKCPNVERAKVHAKKMSQEYQKQRADKERIFAIPRGQKGSSASNRTRAEKLLAAASAKHKEALAQLKAAEKILIEERRALTADSLAAGLEAAAEKEKSECAIAAAAAGKAYLLVQQILGEATLAVNNATASAAEIQDVALAAAVEIMKAAAQEVDALVTEAKMANGVAQAATQLTEASAARSDVEAALELARGALRTLK
ncbi:hypothetical protein C8R47DRAFT_1066084 [Mycena vitilis]|nr:hypothetical protein C8R47DRAFT_1066084 [Mycena vitilis]